jgi:hypothetical protein
MYFNFLRRSLMKNKLAIVFGLMLASGTALAADSMGSGADTMDNSKGNASGTTSGATGTGTGTTSGTTGNTTGSTPGSTPGAAFSGLDKDRDGRISRQEARSSSDISGRFDDADANGDGFLSQTEHQSLSSRR